MQQNSGQISEKDIVMNLIRELDLKISHFSAQINAIFEGSNKNPDETQKKRILEIHRERKPYIDKKEQLTKICSYLGNYSLEDQLTIALDGGNESLSALLIEIIDQYNQKIKQARENKPEIAQVTSTPQPIQNPIPQNQQPNPWGQMMQFGLQMCQQNPSMATNLMQMAYQNLQLIQMGLAMWQQMNQNANQQNQGSVPKQEKDESDEHQK